MKLHQDVTPNELALILLVRELGDGYKSCEFVQYTAETTPKLNKKHRDTGIPLPWNEVVKKVTARCSLKAIYENAVNNALVREGVQEKGENLFEAGELPWGEWLEIDGKRSKVLIRHKGQFYIRTTFVNPNEIPMVTYFADGKEISKDLLKGYLPPEKDELVVVRCYKIDGMREFRMGGMIYNVVQP